ncbi:phosphoenolpyruvate phosphatase isoform X1 [Phalaenopsis equestris]|uniref:phosphoenolpyruvate phosphatase isoform X1 n=3 Tax=Phalaenopsis equestris TaxID=78828 RepID=UPI0009E1F296|nr:phosphoenolpyruvate phosphatase isoform X1 [Phalaenopsis equestris]XP_020579351.1 phosphoenolpyruvate phosphatase isoform X1 [Phalaenopsis equestris]
MIRVAVPVGAYRIEMLMFSGIQKLLLYLLVLSFILLCSVEIVLSGFTSSFIRSEWPSKDIPLDSPEFSVPEGYNAPQQVHITQGDYEGKAVIVSWVNMIEPGSSEVLFGKSENKYNLSAQGTLRNYTFYNYKSGYIHHCLLSGLEYNTRYYYKIGAGSSAREFWFDTPPDIDADASYTFGIIGDLGQTYNSLSTLQHYMTTGGQTVLFVGDLSYADRYHDNDGNRWDSWGRLVERSVAYQPWIWSAGNHEIEYKPLLGEFSTFRAYLHRYATPHIASKSNSPLWYAVRRASAHIIVLSSYSPFVKYTPQWSWLREELNQVDREKTPWLIVLMHAPLYNSNGAHYMEGESMRAAFESWFVHFKVDLVFAGHVHAYERSYRVSNINYNITTGDRYPVPDKSAPVYITVGDGGNQEGLASRFLEPQPEYSAFREASYGHSVLELKNRTHAFYKWIRNDDGKSVPTDHVVFLNQYWAGSTRRRLKKKQPKRHVSLIAIY